MIYNIDDYSSCLFQIPKNGKRVLWEITNSCNYACSYCIFSSGPGKINGELKTDEIYRVLDELKTEAFTHIKFTGGEPFMRKDLIDILKRATKLDFTCDLSTNASAINEINAKKLSEVNLYMVHVSLDGHTKEIQEKIRGNDTYQRTINGINNLKIFTSHYLRIGTVLYKENEGHIEDMIKFYESLGAEEVVFSRMEPIGRMQGNLELNAIKTDDELEKEILELTAKYSERIKVNSSFNRRNQDGCRGSCPGGDKFLFIDNLGRVSPCTWIVEENPSFRSNITLKETSLSQILNSSPLKKYSRVIKIIEERKILGCPARKLEKVLLDIN